MLAFKQILLSLLVLASLTLMGQIASAKTTSQDMSITAQDGTELNLMRYPATGNQLVIWMVRGYEKNSRTTKAALSLADKGIEVWQIDLPEALFLPHSVEQLRKLDGQYIADLIEAAHRQTHKDILLAARSYACIPLLRGARLWQYRQAHKPMQAANDNPSYLKGAILFSPDFYTTIPALGMKPNYVPITYATNIPIMIMQDGNRGNRSYVNRLVQTLVTGGSQPMLKILPGVAGLFFEKDESPETMRALQRLPKDIKTAISLLSKLHYPLTPAPMKRVFKPLGSGFDSQLRSFKGKFPPHPIDLVSATGIPYKRSQFKGQVTIVNFWATWCSPCIREIPSLNRLREKMQGRPFELISINFSEQAKVIHNFLKKVAVKFPVLLDTTGHVALKWKVLTFPSTFVIGPDGKIHYGVNAAIEWDSPEVIKALLDLLPSSTPQASSR